MIITRSDCNASGQWHLQHVRYWQPDPLSAYFGNAKRRSSLCWARSSSTLSSQ